MHIRVVLIVCPVHKGLAVRIQMMEEKVDPTDRKSMKEKPSPSYFRSPRDLLKNGLGVPGHILIL